MDGKHVVYFGTSPEANSSSLSGHRGCVRYAKYLSGQTEL